MKGRSFLYHGFFWIAVYILWIAVFRNYSLTLTKTLTVEFCYLLFIIADYYTVHYYIIPKLFLKKKYALFVITTIAVLSLSAWLRAMVAVQMNLHFFHTAAAIDFSTLYLNSLLNISFWVLMITAGKMLIDRNQTQRQYELLEKERTKNELEYLKAQINPHALFNSINTIYGHIDKSNKEARNILLQFSELLRYQLYDCGAEKVSLHKEIDYIKNYVAFQRLRKNEHLQVSLHIESVEKDLEVAPLLLVVLIENAFKFVSNFSGRENNICIKLCTERGVLNCSVKNTKDHQPSNDPEKSGGIGIVNLKRRLDLLYPEKYNLLTKEENELYETTLNIDLT